MPMIFLNEIPGLYLDDDGGEEEEEEEEEEEYPPYLYIFVRFLVIQFITHFLNYISILVSPFFCSS